MLFTNKFLYVNINNKIILINRKKHTNFNNLLANTALCIFSPETDYSTLSFALAGLFYNMNSCQTSSFPFRIGTGYSAPRRQSSCSTAGEQAGSSESAIDPTAKSEDRRPNTPGGRGAFVQAKISSQMDSSSESRHKEAQSGQSVGKKGNSRGPTNDIFFFLVVVAKTQCESYFQYHP
jgi:hypothetical protein